MKSLVTLVGILLIIFGIGTLAYKGYSYNTQEKIAQIGDVKVTAEHTKTVYFPPMLGGVSLVAGIILVVVGRSSRFK